MSFLSLRNITLRFGGLYALRDVSFDVHQGEILSVIGPNGAGKTSLFNVMTGIYPASEGEILLENKSISEPFTAMVALKAFLIGAASAVGLFLLVNAQSLFQSLVVDRYVYLEPFPWGGTVQALLSFLATAPRTDIFVPLLTGFLVGAAGSLFSWFRARRGCDVVSRYGFSRTFQNIRLYKDLSAQDNIRVSIDRRHRSTLIECALRLPRFFKERRGQLKESAEMLEFVGLNELSGQDADSLSYGDQRRLEIARALATNPKILLLDEPAAGMNPTEAQSLMELIQKIRDRGVTVVLIEHHMKVVMGISDRVVVLDYGNKIAEGSPQEICANQRVIEAYLGKGDHE